MTLTPQQVQLKTPTIDAILITEDNLEEVRLLVDGVKHATDERVFIGPMGTTRNSHEYGPGDWVILDNDGDGFWPIYREDFPQLWQVAP